MHPFPQSEGRPEYFIAMAGTAEPFALLVDLFSRNGNTPVVGRIALSAVIAADVSSAERERLISRGVAFYDSAEELFAQRSDVNLVLDLRGEEEEGTSLVGVPVDVPVVGRPSASILWELISGVPPVGRGHIRRSHTRELLMTIINEMADDILLVSPGGLVLDMNRSVCSGCELSKAELIGQHFSELDDGGFARCEQGVCPFEETIRTGRKAEAMHTRVDADGRMLYYRIYTYPVFSQEGELTHVVIMRRDITDRTNTEQQLLQAQKMAALGELSTYAAHEIRNPLFAIGGFANSLLRSKNLTDSEREKVSIILQESRRLEDILKSMLNFARPTDGQTAVVDVNQVANEAVQLMRHGCEQHEVELVLETADDLANAQGTPELIKQCLINIIKNSMEAMDGGGHVSVTTGMSGRWVQVVVRDDGPGIPEEMQNKVFNPFFSTKDKGSGLGLAMTRKIIDDLGGRLQLESAPGKGTEVRMRLLPIAAVETPLLDEQGEPE